MPLQQDEAPQYDDIVPEGAVIQTAAASSPLMTTVNGDLDTPSPFDTSDASMDSHGHYYLGGGRRRIGAGFTNSPPDPFHQDLADNTLPVQPLPLAPEPTPEPTEQPTTPGTRTDGGSGCEAVNGCADDDCFVKEQSKGQYATCAIAISKEGRSTVCSESSKPAFAAQTLVLKACPLACGLCTPPKTPPPSAPPTAPSTEAESTPTAPPTAAVEAIPAGDKCYIYGNDLQSANPHPCPSVQALAGEDTNVEVNPDECALVPARSLLPESVLANTEENYGSYPEYPADDVVSKAGLGNFKEMVNTVQKAIHAAEKAVAAAKDKANAAEEAKKAGNVEEAARLEKEAAVLKATAVKDQAASEAAKKKATTLHAIMKVKIDAEAEKIRIDTKRIKVPQPIPGPAQGHFNESSPDHESGTPSKEEVSGTPSKEEVSGTPSKEEVSGTPSKEEVSGTPSKDPKDPSSSKSPGDKNDDDDDNLKLTPKPIPKSTPKPNDDEDADVESEGASGESEGASSGESKGASSGESKGASSGESKGKDEDEDDGDDDGEEQGASSADIKTSKKDAYYTFQGTPLDGNKLCCPPGWVKYGDGSGCTLFTRLSL